MRKRKELDALVANSGSGKSSAGSGKQRGGPRRPVGLKSVVSSEQHKAARAQELLGNESDSSELLDDYSILHPHQRTKKGGGGLVQGLCCSASCLPLCLVVLISTCMVALGTLLWLHLGLREDLDLMRAHLQKVEAQSKETPEALHDYHIQLKGLESNVTSFAQDLKRINTEILSLQDAVKKLKEESTGLRESIAAAPEIKSLPKDVVSLTQSVASLGSKISMLESNVQDLKQGQHQLTDSARELKTENQQLKGSLAGLSAQKESSTTPEDGQALRTSLTQYVHQELVQVASAVDDMNATVAAHLHDLEQHLQETNQSLAWVTNDLAHLHVFVYQNLSGSLVRQGSEAAVYSAALQQEAQRMLWELMSNWSRANQSEVPPTGQPLDWRDVLGHAHQVALAYWALLRDLSLTTVDQEPAGIAAQVLDKAVIHLTANITTALQSLNNSLRSLALRTQSLESLTHPVRNNQETQEPSSTAPLGGPLAAQLGNMAGGQQEGSGRRFHETRESVEGQSPSSSSSSSSSGAVAAAAAAEPTKIGASRGVVVQQEVSPNPPTSTIPPSIEDFLRRSKKLSVSGESSDRLRQQASDLVPIPQ